MAALTALLALNAASTINKFAGERQQATAAERQGAYEQGVYNVDAQLADQQAADAIARGKEAETRQRQATRGLIGAQRATLAAQGIDVSTGSALDVQADTAALGELDALTIRNNAAREAFGYRVQAMDYRNQGAMAALAGKNQAAALRNQSYSTLLTGAANTYGIYREFSGKQGS